MDGRRAIVTGGAAGLGRAIADRLAAAGAKVTIVDLAEALERADGRYPGHALDLSGEDARIGMARIADGLGGLDILVANAGVVPPWRGLREIDGAEWRHVMAVNTWGVAAAIGGCADALARSEHASVVAMASINGYRAHPAQTLYTASKHAVIGIVRSAALDLGPSGIRVNAVAPGPIATDALIARIAARHETGGPTLDEALAALDAETALGRMATEGDVARVAHFLASDASVGMTGCVLPVEAGLV
ncbi:SDR family NAD(P)-dependent oxidoreductase [uncultured Jannaschia sp.]|uniref:SDR family NAD(P)-dependent oxidoreductase n=1 Tax=uncultured Jannaschia sp. TaxID=293347 RepID=UPI0026217D95|nr:SDR family oxidoreductase [uncultured Jannaschia sp.]